ncbi:hypothetical protein IQ268_16120 [Oculatella sp. LEGE 06141]|uniref:hypothetical protein n=1 Tax=Oculatella sp. LEGE 06141 TaxID=1828648 RepID=UPI00188007E4|nr:hypothetical protein [Oculatella sp. LEGE 06141]MBE9180098.1 hypothetical protein [Oculatella sp. LEGE 06141]
MVVKNQVYREWHCTQAVYIACSAYFAVKQYAKEAGIGQVWLYRGNSGATVDFNGEVLPSYNFC